MGAATFVVPIVAALLVRALFKVSQQRWPQSYFGIDDGAAVDPITDRSIPFFLVWRLLPVFLGALVSAITVDRLEQDPLVSTLVFWVSYVALSFAVAGVRLASIRRSDRSPSTNFLVQFVLAVASAFVAWAAYLCRGALAGFVPGPEPLLEGVWVAVILVSGMQLLDGGMRFRREEREFAKRSRSEVDPELLQAAANAAVQYNADPRVVEAVLLTENLQRPSWVRRIERVTGRRFPAGSYGVMQYRGSRPVSDLESIQQVVARHLANAQIPTRGYASLDTQAVAAALGGLNRSQAWSSVFSRVLAELTETNEPPTLLYASTGSTVVGHSGDSVLQLGQVQLYDGGMFVELTTTTDCGYPLHLALVGRDGNAVTEVTVTERSWSGSEVVAVAWASGGAALSVSAEGPVADGMRPGCRFDLPSWWQAQQEGVVGGSTA